MPLQPNLLAPAEFVRSDAAMSAEWAPREAERYTRWLATHHYENFHVVSVLLPRRLHQDFYNVYAFCRWADDLGDEIGDKQESLRYLNWWREELDSLYDRAAASHPVFVALRETARRHAIPKDPYADLLRAFVQDQHVSRYEAWEDVFAYCRYSANPVGRLVLYLCGYCDAERQRLSDFTCTALQLANFWQDVSVDLRKDRVYVPLEVLRRHGYTPEELFAGVEDERFRGAMRDAVNEAEKLFLAGLPLVGMVDRRLSIDLDLFSRGGMRILEKIRAQNYGVLRRRPAIGKAERAAILLRTLARAMFQRAA